MKKASIILLLGIVSGCSKVNFEPTSSAILKGFKPIKGKHCESSAVINMLNYQGYQITEEQFLGAGSVLGFVYELSKFPFLGGRTLKLKENASKALGIKFHQGSITEKDDGWDYIYKLLSKGNPITLRVDMRYLPYLFGGKYGPKHTSFGWHMICLTGINAENQTALVTDTSLEGLQTIKLKDLHKARFSKLKVMPPEGEYYWVEKKGADFTPNWEDIALESLSIVKTEMSSVMSDDKNLIGLDGLSLLPEVLSKLDERVPSYLLSTVLEVNSGFIETYGTGGSAFRKMYYEYIKETGENTGNRDLLEAASKLELVVTAWKDLATEMKVLSGKKEIIKNPEQRRVSLIKLRDTAQRVYEKELDFYSIIKNN